MSRQRDFAYWRRQPVLEKGHFDDLVYDDGRERVWVSRQSLADYDGNRRAWLRDRLTVERRGRGGVWRRVRRAAHGRTR